MIAPPLPPMDSTLSVDSLHGSSGGRPTPRDAATQLEGVFVSLLLKTMRETMTEGEMFGGDTADIWGGLFDQSLGEEIARQGGLGIADQLSLEESVQAGRHISFAA